MCISVTNVRQTMFRLSLTLSPYQLLCLVAGADIHRQLYARTADQHIRRQQHHGQSTFPGHVQQRHRRDQRKKLSSRFERRTTDTQQQHDRVEWHWISSSQVSFEYYYCFFFI